MRSSVNFAAPPVWFTRIRAGVARLEAGSVKGKTDERRHAQGR